MLITESLSVADKSSIFPAPVSKISVKTFWSSTISDFFDMLSIFSKKDESLSELLSWAIPMCSIPKILKLIT